MTGAETYIDGRTTFAGNRHTMLAFEEAAELLDLEPWIIQRLRHPLDEYTAYLQVTRDSGESVCVPFVAVHHNEMSEGCAGSLALVPGLQLRDCQAEARERAWQSALLGLPFGGASYGIVCDPVLWSEKELTSLVHPLARQLAQRRGNQIVFPGRGCHREFMGRLCAELSDSHSVAVTGQPECMSALDHMAFTTEGIAAAISAALRHAGRPSIGARVAIQGFGELGQVLSRRLASEGMKIIALSDNSGGIYRVDGLIVSDLGTQVAHDQLLLGYKEAEHLSRADVINVDSDVLVLTAGSNELNEINCKKVAAGIVVEAERNAISEAAKDVLEEKNITVMPWFLATCGVMVASLFQLQKCQILNKPQELLARCYGIVGQVVDLTLHSSADARCLLEQAAYRIAVETAANCIRTCGRQQ